ncbi:hypothetical protein Pmani_026206 [Petrolisthes manimaculis]|uniref:Uncharacterized protein n=1 Tax=Petrolisthes manimaculis TaxID=1843537 RepID=A0AAE1P4J2_9EUCA|nr:hypothetical protein Pmani_026206 [Petrolisthes manimaculis]
MIRLLQIGAVPLVFTSDKDHDECCCGRCHINTQDHWTYPLKTHGVETMPDVILSNIPPTTTTAITTTSPLPASLSHTCLPATPLPTLTPTPTDNPCTHLPVPDVTQEGVRVWVEHNVMMKACVGLLCDHHPHFGTLPNLTCPFTSHHQQHQDNGDRQQGRHTTGQGRNEHQLKWKREGQLLRMMADSFMNSPTTNPIPDHWCRQSNPPDSCLTKRHFSSSLTICVLSLSIHLFISCLRRTGR